MAVFLWQDIEIEISLLRLYQACPLRPPRPLRHRPVAVDSRRGSTLAQACITFGPMNPHEPIFVAPPITEIPDYVWSPRYDRPSWIPGRPVKKPKDTSRRIPHPDAETALKAAKKACREKAGRWFGRVPEDSGPIAFLVYEDSKVVERHVVCR